MAKAARTANDLYFVTLTIVNWIDIFTRPAYKDFIINNLAFCQENKNLEIFEYVIMTNHLHMICRSTDIPLFNVLRDFKTFTSKELFKMIRDNPKESRRKWMIPIFKNAGKSNKPKTNFKVWKNNNWPTLMRHPAVIYQKQKYIRMNPVKARIVKDPENYYYSSAHPFGPLVTLKL